MLSPVWEYAANFIPSTVAPNVITLAGFVCTLQVHTHTHSLHMSYAYSLPRALSAAAREMQRLPLCVCTYICNYVYLCVRVCTCVCTCVGVCVRLCTCVCFGEYVCEYYV